MRARRAAVVFVATTVASLQWVAADAGGISLHRLGSYRTGVLDAGAAEIVAHDARTQRLFVVNGANGTIDVIAIGDPTQPVLLFEIDVSSFGPKANSVAVSGGVVAAAVQAPVPQDAGTVVLYDSDGAFLSAVTVGALPDMLTFTPDGTRILVANEGEPSDDYSVDPEGSVSIIDVSRGARAVTQEDVATVGFDAIGTAALDASVRVFGPGASIAQDCEPEYIAVSADSKVAWVTLQENNAVAIVDVDRAAIVELVGLGAKNHRRARNRLDASDEDGAALSRHWPVWGLPLPDAIASFVVGGRTFLITANEGDSRDYTGFSEEARVADLTLDPARFPDAATLQRPENLGRLKVTTTAGDLDGDGDYDALFSYGARSFTIWTADVEPLFDSGRALERITARAFPDDFNSDNAGNGTFDSRSDDKGPEPEGVTVGQVDGRTYAFVGLERIGGVVVYDVTRPSSPRFVQYVNDRDFQGDPGADTAGDLGPEGLLFIPRSQSPVSRPLLVVANEVSGSTTIYRVDRR